MTKRSDQKFPSSAQIARAITAVAKTGMAVGSVGISPSGELRIYAVTSEPMIASNDFDEWDRRDAL